MRSRRAARLLAAIVIIGASIGVAGPAVARFTGGAAATATFTADRLDAPAGLAVSGGLGLTATLTWTAVGESYAQGYRVYRSATSGSGYALVATVTPRTTTSTTNTPIVPGTYYYVVRAFAGSWLGPAGNEVSIPLL